MNGTNALGTADTGVWRSAGEIIFQWIPATINALFNGGTGGMFESNPPLTSPLSPTDAVAYVDQSSGIASTTFAANWGVFVTFSFMLSLLLAVFLAYLIIRLSQIRRLEERRFGAAAHSVAAGDVSKTQLRWERIMEHIGSGNDQQWRLAILEADIMLNELLDTLGYRGETMGEKMRTVERGDFNTIDLAWEAHRTRNKIAHEGAALLLTHREARRIIDLYERVFREFRFIQ